MVSQSMIDEVVEVRDLAGGVREYTVRGQIGDQVRPAARARQ